VGGFNLPHAQAVAGTRVWLGQTSFTPGTELMVKKSRSAFGTEGMLCSTEDKVLPSLSTGQWKEYRYCALIQENSFTKARF